MSVHIIAVEESDSSVGIYDSDTLEEVARIGVGTWPHEIALDAGRTTAYVSNFGIKDYDEHIGQPGASISVIDLATMAERDRLYTFRDGKDYERRRAPHAVLFDEARNRLLVNVEAEDALLHFDLGDVAALSEAEANRLCYLSSQPAIASDVDHASPLPNGTHTMLLSADGARLFLGCSSGGLVEIDAQSGAALRTLNCGGAVRGLSLTADGRNLLVSAGGSLCLVDPEKMLVIKRHDFAVAQFLYPVATPDGVHALVPAVWEGMLFKIHLESGKAERLITGSDPIHVIIPQDGPHAFVGHGRSPYVTKIAWDAFEEVGRIRTRGGPNGLEWAPARAKPEPGRLRIGAVIPLTGPSFREGQDLRLGYQFWAEQVNAGGGLYAGGRAYEIELLYRDSRSYLGKPEEAPLPDGRSTSDYLKDEAKALVGEGAVAIFGSYPSPPHFALRDAADELDVPLITASGAAGGIYQAGSRNVFGIMSSANGFLNETFDLLARQDDPPRTALFIACEDPAATGDARTTARHAEDRLGIKILGPDGATGPVEDRILPFAHNATDFDEQLQIGAEFEPDVIAMTGHLGEAIAFTRAVAELDLSPKALVYSVGPAMPAFVQALGDMSVNLMGSAMWSPAQKTWGHDRFVTPATFRDAFFERFSKEPSYLAAGAAACGLVFEEASRRAASAAAADILAVLRDGFAMQSFYSPIELDETGLNSKRRLLTIQLHRTEKGIVQAALWPPSLAGARPTPATWPFPGWPEADEHDRH